MEEKGKSVGALELPEDEEKVEKEAILGFERWSLRARNPNAYWSLPAERETIRVNERFE